MAQGRKLGMPWAPQGHPLSTGPAGLLGPPLHLVPIPRAVCAKGATTWHAVVRFATGTGYRLTPPWPGDDERSQPRASSEEGGTRKRGTAPL